MIAGKGELRHDFACKVSVPGRALGPATGLAFRTGREQHVVNDTFGTTRMLNVGGNEGPIRRRP